MTKARTYLPTDKHAPRFIQEIYETPKVDFDLSLLDKEKLKAFEQLVAELCHDFTVYSGMFGNEEQREATYKLGRDVILIVERAMLTQICLRYSALIHDKWNKKGEEVVSLKQLIQPLNSASLNSKLTEMEEFYNKSNLKRYRNKVIAHNDLKVFQRRNSNIPKLTTEQIEQQLHILNECLNYLKDRQEVSTDIIVQLSFGEGLDKYQMQLQKI